MAESDPLVEALNRNAASNEKLFARQEKKDKEDTKFKPGKLVGALAKNSAAVLGLSQGLTSIRGFFSQAVKDNQQITKQLALFSTATSQNTRQMTNSLNTGFTLLKEGIETQGELIDAGLGDFSKANKESFIGMKALGINLKSSIAITRFNTEALGISAERSVELSKSVVEAAMANGTSIGELVGAIESMKVALTKTAVELGPEMSMKVQNVVARMTQNNSELAGAASQFVTSFLAGEDGFMKAARLGVGFTGQETEAELVAKIEQLSKRIAEMTAGAQGFGGGIAFQRFEDAFGISRENVLIAREMGRDIKELERGSIKSAADQLAKLDASRQIELKMFRLQAKGVDVMQGIGHTVAKFAGWIPQVLVLLGMISATSQAMLVKNALWAGEGAQGVGAKTFMRTVGIGMAVAAAGMALKSAHDLIKAEPGERKRSDIGTLVGTAGGAIGGALLGAKIGAVGGPMGMAIGSLIGGLGGKFIGEMFDEGGNTGEEQKKAQQWRDQQFGLTKDNEKNTAEIKRIQEEQQRRQNSLANPQITLLTSINDVLVQNMIALQRANRQRELANEVRKDMQFSTGLAAPSLSPSIGNF